MVISFPHHQAGTQDLQQSPTLDHAGWIEPDCLFSAYCASAGQLGRATSLTSWKDQPCPLSLRESLGCHCWGQAAECSAVFCQQAFSGDTALSHFPALPSLWRQPFPNLIMRDHRCPALRLWSCSALLLPALPGSGPAELQGGQLYAKTHNTATIRILLFATHVLNSLAFSFTIDWLYKGNWNLWFCSFYRCPDAHSPQDHQWSGPLKWPMLLITKEQMLICLFCCTLCMEYLILKHALFPELCFTST